MARNVFSVDNMEIHKNKNSVLIAVNPKIYPIDTVFSASYIFIDRAYVIIDGDPNEEIIVQLKAKDRKVDLEKLGRDFNNELVNYSFYAMQTVRNMPIRSAIIQRALSTHAQQEQSFEKIKKLKRGGKKVGKSKGKKK
jgi:His-Xaa-Ser system protein HxsD